MCKVARQAWIRSLRTLAPRRLERRTKRTSAYPVAHAICELFEDRVLLSGMPATADFSVMSRNLYVGTDLQPIIDAIIIGDELQVVQAVTAGWQQVLATDFQERAEVLADEIVDNSPILVGLQEVALWRTGAPLDPAEATQVEFDFLDILIDELAERGLSYEAVAVSTNFDAETTGFVDPFNATSLRDIRLTDRDVILARSDLPASQLKLSNAMAGTFSTNVTVPAGDGFLEITRGWTSVNAKIRGQEFRFINTHLELDLGPAAPPIQYLQTLELLAGPANTQLPVVLVGDFNARAEPGVLVYETLVGAGFEDVWALTNPGEAGGTCCHDADLRNEVVDFDEGRIDLILFRGNVGAVSADRIGDELEDRTSSGLWPSDHAGVVARLFVGPPAWFKSERFALSDRMTARGILAQPLAVLPDDSVAAVYDSTLPIFLESLPEAVNKRGQWPVHALPNNKQETIPQIWTSIELPIADELLTG